MEVSKSPASSKNATLSLRALQRNAWQSTTKNATNDSSIADFAKADSSKVDIAKEKSSVASLAKAKSNNANFASAKSTHPQTPSAREGAFKANVIPKNAKTTPKKRLALSLATSAILASLSIDSIAAACRWEYRDEGGIGYYQTRYCDGSESISSLNSQLSASHGVTFTSSNYYATTNIHLGGKNGSQLNVSGSGTVSMQFETKNGGRSSTTKNLIFGNVLAGNVTFALNVVDSKTTANVSTSADTRIGGLELQGTNGGNINALTINGGSYIGSIIASTSNPATIITLNLGQGNQHLSSPILGNNVISNTITNFNLYKANVVINSDAATFNNFSGTGQEGAHLVIKQATNKTLQSGAKIYVTVGNEVEMGKAYSFDKLVTDSSGSKLFSNGITFDNLVDTAGVKLINSATTNKCTGSGFCIEAEATTSYGASLMRALVLSNLRRNTMTQNILDTMTTKTFHSDRYYNQEVELRLLQYDLSRLTNRSSKFSKQTRKNTKKVDKVREKMARLTLEQSKGQNLDKGYNNYELIDQLDAIFIPYTGRRDWRFFALPYATHSYVDFGSSQAMEYAGGALFGVQRNLRANGIFGGYVGYEFVNTDTALMGTDTRAQTNSVQAGVNYFKTFSVPAKVWEGFIKANIRGGVDLPTLNIIAGGGNSYLKSNDKASSLPLMYSVGAEVKGGVTFYQYKRNSYLSPEVSLSYDMISTTKMLLDKYKYTETSTGGTTLTYYPLGADERYSAIYWHLPQLGAALRYYKMWGNTFRTNLKVGLKYNMLNTQKLNFRIGNLEDKGEITLPAVYGNLAFDMIWMIKKNHELSFGYDGLFYASSFAKERDNTGKNVATSDWFNGVSTNLNFKYAYWFGGSDYVTDKDGNAVARSIVEGSKKKSKKPKKKKEKKSKKKVYYIDG